MSDMSLQGKHIVIGISGGIAAYKIPSLIRLCIKAGAEVKVITTTNALHFVAPLTLETLSHNKVYSDVFAPTNDHSTEHISLAQWADLMVVAPATANIIAKFANGIADDALSTQFLACTAPVIIAPAMNTQMLHHPATQHNLAQLSTFDNIRIIKTTEGDLACGQTGDGRMAEPEDIFNHIEQALTPQDLAGKRVMITAGPTREQIDPVRYISNFSTGKMGYALAAECAKRGAEVVVISGPTSININYQGIRVVKVISAHEMYDAAIQHFGHCDIAILCAAVADYRPLNISPVKIKCERNNPEADLCINLTATPDIAAELGKHKTTQTIVGFALETNDEESNAIDKMRRKNLDFIVLNSLNNEGAGFGYDTNQITIFYHSGQRWDFELKTKSEVAKDIINTILDY